jgi:PAT family beta-lactamase induction signal transducer AmpG
MTTPTSAPSLKEALFNKRMLMCIFTGFSSGLPLFVFINMLPAWLNDSHVDIKAIGLMALLQTPYVAKFLWSPLLDHFKIGNLGRRRGWILFIHLALMMALIGMGSFNPATDLAIISLIGVGVAFLSASLDIVIDAYRRELLPDIELGLGNTIHVNAYKLAGLIPGSLALYLSDTGLSWPVVFMVVAGFLLPSFFMFMSVKEPELKVLAPRSLNDAVVLPFKEFFQRKGVIAALEILLFIFLYKLGDSLATSLATKFYLDLGFSKTEIAIIAKNAGLWCGIIGGMLGGIWMIKLGINRALWIFGFVQWLVIPLFALLAGMGADKSMLFLVVGAESFGVGLGTAAFVAFIASSTHPAYTATQLALLTALAAVPRTVINAYSGYMVDSLGWVNFFWLCTALGIPGLLMLMRVAPWPRNNETTAS